MKRSLITSMLMMTLSLTSLAAHALTDEEALAEGMTPIDSRYSNLMTNDPFLMMKNFANANPTAFDIEEAIRTHRLVITVNKASTGPTAQTLIMYENGVEVFRDKISTGREKQEKATSGRVYFSTTPKGFYRPEKIYTDYLSYTWDAPMPNSVFIVGGIAIHATKEAYYQNLGSRASGGCVRTKLATSKFIREKVMDTGMGSAPGQYKIVNEAKGRNRIMNNSVQVDQISRTSGKIINNKVQSWDAVVVVYEQ